MIRGFAANRVLLVVDGVRMNNAIYRSGNLQNVISLDANSIENSEIIFGPGSVIYGSDAIGGVMDFHTLDANLSTNNKIAANANSLIRYSSANKEKTAHVDFNIGMKKIAFLTSLTYSDFGDLKMGNKNHDSYIRKEYVETINNKDQVINNQDINTQKFTAYKQFNFMQKIIFKPNKNWDFQYGLHYSRLSNVPRYDRLIQYKNNKLKYAQWYYGPQKWMMNAINVKYKGKTKIFDRAKFILAHQLYEESRHDRKFGKALIRERSEKVLILSLNIDFDKQINSKSFLFYGVDIQSNHIGSTGQTRNITTGETKAYASRYPDGSKYKAFAIYTNYKNNISPKSSFIAGIRYSHILLHSRFDNTFYKFPFNKIDINTGAFNATVGFVYRPKNSLQLNINASSGFRAPNIDDVGKVFDSEPGNVVVPNENLHSEYAYNFELGIVKTFYNKIKIDISGFYTILNNAMVRRDFTFNGKTHIVYDNELSKVQALTNASEAIVYGIQTGVFADITRNISLKTNINYSKGTDQDGLPLRHVAPLFGSIHLLFAFSKLKLDLYAEYNGQIANENMADSEKNKDYMYAKDSKGKVYSPAWATLNFKLKYQLNKNLSINAGVENIFNVRYRPYSSGIVAPGRNFIIALRTGLVKN